MYGNNKITDLHKMRQSGITVLTDYCGNEWFPANCNLCWMIRYEGESEKLADDTSCAGVRADLKMCLLESDCCKKDGMTPRECLRSNNVPLECQVLRNTFFECKRSLLDNRTRFRGRKGY